MRARCKSLKAWHAARPDVSNEECKRTRAGALLLLRHIALTVEFDGDSTSYLFEYDTAHEHACTTDTERALAVSYDLLEAWKRGEDVTMLKLAA